VGVLGELSADGRVPLLRHEKALGISTTLFREQDYQDGFGETIAKTRTAFPSGIHISYTVRTYNYRYIMKEQNHC
jgi:hypothetical protein